MIDKEKFAISLRLKKLMENRKVTANDLASSIGVSAELVENWINAKATPTFIQLCFIDQFFGIKMGYWL